MQYPKFITMSDLHAGLYSKDYESGLDRLEIIRKALSATFHTAIKVKKTNLILFPGDLTDGNSKHQAAVRAQVLTMLHKEFLKWFTKHPDIVFIAIDGNHDQDGKSVYPNYPPSTLDFFASAFPDNFFLIKERTPYVHLDIDQYGKYFVTDSKSSIRITGIPYCLNFKEALDDLLPKKDKKVFDILMMHQTLDLIPFNVDILNTDKRFKVFDCVINGHLHKNHFFGNNVYNIGSPIIRDRSDIGVDKGICYFDGSTMEFIKFGNPVFPEWVSLTLDEEIPKGNINYINRIPKKINKKINTIENELSVVSDLNELIDQYLKQEGIKDKVYKDIGKDLISDIDSLSRTKAEIQLDEVYITGFGSIRDRTRFPLSKGITLLSAGNGIGKTTMLNSLPWAFWGIDLKGRKGEEVLTKESLRGKDYKGAKVSVSFFKSTDEKSYVVLRSRNKSTKLELLIDGEDCSGKTVAETQQKINDIIGIDQFTFLRTCFYGQDTDTILSGSEAQRVSFFEDIFGLEFISIAQQKAKDFYNELEDKNSKNQIEIEKLDLKLAGIKEVKIVLADQLDNRENTYRTLDKEVNILDGKIKTLQAQLDSPEASKVAKLTKELTTIEKSLKTSLSTQGSLQNDLAKVEALKKRLEDKGGKVKKKVYNENLTMLSELEDLITELKESIEVLKSSKQQLNYKLENASEKWKNESKKSISDICNTCDQKLPADKVASLEADRQERIAELYEEKTKLSEKIETKSNQLTKKKEAKDLTVKNKNVILDTVDNQRSRRNIQKEIKELEKKDIKTCLTLTSTDITTYETKAKSIRSQLIKLAASTNIQNELRELTSIISGKKVDLHKAESALQKTIKDQNDKEAERKKLVVQKGKLKKSEDTNIDVYKWWATVGFNKKGLKSYLFDVYLQGLNEKLEQLEVTLGIGVKFSISEAASRKFKIDCYLPGNKETVDYLSLSGGEKSRVTLLIVFAILLYQRNFTSLNSVFLDEMLKGLDSDGVASFFELCNVLVENNLNVYCVTHRQGVDQYGINIVDLVKENGVTRIA